MAKSLVSSLNTAAASVWFIIHGAVIWPQTFAMMTGCLIGGFYGVHLSRRVPQELVRWVGDRGRPFADRGVCLEVLVLEVGRSLWALDIFGRLPGWSDVGVKAGHCGEFKVGHEGPKPASPLG